METIVSAKNKSPYLFGMGICSPTGKCLLGDLGRAGLADDRHADLTRVLHGFLDLFGDIARQTGGGKIVDGFRLDDDTHFASSLDGESLLYAIERHGHLFERADAFDV